MLQILESGRDPHLQIWLDKNLPTSLVTQRLQHFFQRPLLDLHGRCTIGPPIESVAGIGLQGLFGRGHHRGDEQSQRCDDSLHSAAKLGKTAFMRNVLRFGIGRA